jgi:hypothetical protein
MLRKNRFSLFILCLTLMVVLSGCRPQDPQAEHARPEPAPVKTESDVPEAVPATPAEETPPVFFAVHIETSDHNTQSASVADEWLMLVSLVEMADSYGHKLTLEFQPQWAEYALAHPEALTQIRAWEANGHEIAFHHHGLSHAAWDGYTNATGHSADAGYRGTMDEALALVSQLPAGGIVRTAGMTDEETDWLPALIYATGGTGKSGGGLRSTPGTVSYNGMTVTQVSNQGYVLSVGKAASFAEVLSALGQAGTGEVIGIVTHPFDFWAHQAEVEKLFGSLQARGIQTQTVTSILETR